VRAFKNVAKLIAALALGLLVSMGCESTDSGGSAEVHGSMYYGVGFYDPWYYGGGYYPPDVIVTPPPERPIDPPHVEHYNSAPPSGSVSAPRPMPTIPSAPRPALRR
jgi:hypothetical protein